MNVPKLRFKEFNDEWQSINLADIFQYFSTNSFSREQLSESGILKNLHYGDIHRKYNSIVNENKEITSYVKDINYVNKYELLKNNDLIFADASEDHEGIGKAVEVVNVNNNTVSGLHTILARDNSNVFAPMFKGYYFNSPIVHNQIRVLANGFKIYGISKEAINKLNIKIPSIKEQSKIANTFYLFDKKIELQNKKIEDLKLFKKGLNKNIFSNFNAKYKIDELIKEYNQKTSKNNQFEVLSSTANGIILQNEYFNKQAASLDNTGYKIVPFGFITYRSMSDTGEFHFNIQNITENGIVSPAYPVFEINEDIVDKTYFIYYINENKSFKNKILSLKEGGTRYALSMSKFKEINLDLPPLEFQKKCSKLLNTYNRKSKNEENKLNKLQKLKKGLMQNMFV